jgi:transposase-like protein
MQTLGPDYSPDPTLTPQQHQVMNLLADGHSIIGAAAAAGISRNTIRNWRRCVPAFARELEFATREQALAWHEQALLLAPIATKTISDILNDPEASPALRLRAAIAILKMAADPQPKPLRAIPTAAAEMEAAHGELLAFRANSASREKQIPAQSCTTTAIRLAPEPGRNSLCPCGSGQKYKRCCSQSVARSA